MTIILRGDRVPVRITGAGAQKLLNDTLTTRIDPDEAGARWWALLSPQGKILAEGLIGRANGAFWLDVDATIAESFLKRMRLYRLRAEVEFDDLSFTHTVGWSQGERPASQGAIVHKDRRTPSLGVRLIAEKPAAIDWLADDSAYQKNRIANGIAELGHDFDSESLFPHDVGMDLLGGIDFAKGCYIGQEVVSRMQHRGTARRRPVIVTGDTLVKGEALMAGAREAGTLGTPSGTSALSIARLDRFTASPDASVGGHPVALVLPEWASYGFGVPDSAETTAPAAT